MDLRELTCAGCGAPLPYLAEPLAAGTVVACRYCGRAFVVGGGAAEPAPARATEGAARLAMALPDGSYMGRCVARAEAHGMRRGPVSGTNFSGWEPRSEHDVLLVAALADRAQMDESLWADYLPRSWPELVSLLGRQPSATFEGRTGRGNRVLALLARDPVELRRAIASLQLGEEHVPPSSLPIHDVPRDATRVSIVMSGGDFTGHAQLRLEALGYRPWTGWGTNFREWRPGTDDEVLLIAVRAGAVPFDESCWVEYLGRPWPELVPEIQRRGRGQIERRLANGHRVVLAFGATPDELRRAIEELRF